MYSGVDTDRLERLAVCYIPPAFAGFEVGSMSRVFSEQMPLLRATEFAHVSIFELCVQWEHWLRH